jgi:hypothetical protein
LKSKFTGSFFGILILLLICAYPAYRYYQDYNQQPIPQHIFQENVIPQSTDEIDIMVDGNKKVVGYRIETVYNYLISSPNILDEKVFFVKGIFPQNTIDSFARLKSAVDAELTLQAGNTSRIHQPMAAYGDILYKGENPHLFKGKQVVLLYKATYLGEDFEIDRSRSQHNK